MAEKKTALVIIDVLNDFYHPKGALYCGEAARKTIPFIKKQIENFRPSGDSIIYLCDTHRPDDPEFKLFAPHAIKGTWGGEIIPELAPQKNDFIVEKRRFSGFCETQLHLILRENQITELTIAGVCTNICVLYTAMDARNWGFSITVPKNCVATFDQKAHPFALDEMAKNLGVKVI